MIIVQWLPADLITSINEDSARVSLGFASSVLLSLGPH